jgi:hypothetical protein
MKGRNPLRRGLLAFLLVFGLLPASAQAQFTQQAKLVGTGAVGLARQGWSVSLSRDGNTAIVSGINDNGGGGAAWVYTRSGGVWSQQGPKLIGTGAIGLASQGWSVSLSRDGNTPSSAGLMTTLVLVPFGSTRARAGCGASKRSSSVQAR